VSVVEEQRHHWWCTADHTRSELPGRWRDASGSVLVGISQNETPTILARGCRPAETLGGYRLEELRRCLAAR